MSFVDHETQKQLSFCHYLALGMAYRVADVWKLSGVAKIDNVQPFLNSLLTPATKISNVWILAF